MKQFDLSGKVALVIGGATAVGRAIGVALAEAGAEVSFTTLNADRQQEVAANSAVNEVWALGKKGFAVAIDATDPAQVEATVRRAADEFGRLDILVNNTDLPFAKPLADTTPDEWQRVLMANLSTVFFACQAAGAVMLPQSKGRIINVTSILGERGLVNSTAYCAAKAGVVNLTRALGLEWARTGVTVNGIGVGFVQDAPGVGQDESSREALEHYLPLRRLARSSEMAGVAVYLASDASEFITGQTIFVEGGALAHV
jgi:NAD(P)-dependent dehydrogenase (short-subunit alcohol dehydrogenase family)